MKLTGDMLIGGQAIAGNGEVIHAIDPTTNEVLAPRLNDRVRQVASGADSHGPNQGRAYLFLTQAKDFLADRRLQEEIFGAASLVVQCAGDDEWRQVAERLAGQLTATLHLDEADVPAARKLVQTLERKAGRLLVNGWPTGVEVCAAMVHGGPFPATSDARAKSVGTAAIQRFLRPVCYQDFPENLLPAPLASANPLKPRRLFDGLREA